MKKYAILILLLLVAAMNFNLILKPLNLVTGGTQGLAIIVNHLFKIRPSLLIFIINGIMLILSLIFLKKETNIGTILATFIYPLFIKLTRNLSLSIFLSLNIFAVIISGIVCGITCGIIYRLGFSTGGINVVSLILKKYFSFKIAITNFIINFIIIGFGCFYFGLLKSICSIIIIVINSSLIYLIMKTKKRTNL